MNKRLSLALSLALLCGCDRAAPREDIHCPNCQCFDTARPVQIVTQAKRVSSASKLDAGLSGKGTISGERKSANPRKLRMKVTAYCPCAKCCGQFADGITASGKPAKGKLIAADKRFAFGTRMHVPGYGTASVEDRGGAIKGDRLDLLFPTHQDALQWGVKYLDVTINP